MVKSEVIDEFVQAIQQPETDSNTTYSAIVSRIDGEGVVWVNLVGSDKETPTASTASEVKRGDNVTVNWRNNKLYIEGNYSDPSAGTERVYKVESVAKDAHTQSAQAQLAAERAESDAERARAAAESAEADAALAAGAASAAQQSASNAGISASQAQAASEAAQLAALSSITTDVVHYLATDLDSGITTANPPAGHGTWSTTVQTMTSTNKYLWTYHTYSTAGGSSTDTTPVLTGTYGEKGADGTSVTILGSYNTLAELQQAHPTGTLGDAYIVSGDLYVWNGSAWENVGQIQGPQGPQGIQGTSVTVTSVAYAVTTTETEPSSYPYSTAPTIPEGSWLWTKTTFSDGNSAVTKSKQGVSGTNGTDGDDGVSVTSVQPQYYLSTSDSSATGGTWSLSLTYVVGKFIWTRDYITYSDGSHSTSTEIYNQALTQSCEDAAEALGIVEEQQEYFWHDSLGAHVLSDTSGTTRYRMDLKGAGAEIFSLGQSAVSLAKFGADGIAFKNNSGAERAIFNAEWLALGNQNGARLTLSTSSSPYIYMNDGTAQAFRADSNGVVIGNPSNKHSKVDSNGLHVYIGAESTASNEVALFGATARLGKSGSNHISVGDSATAFYSGSTYLGSIGIVTGSNGLAINAQKGLALSASNGISLFTGLGDVGIQATGTTQEIVLSGGKRIYLTTNGSVSNSTIELDAATTIVRRDLNANRYLGLYKITQVAVSVGTIAAGDNVSSANRTMSAQGGYKAVGIVGWSSSNWRVHPTSHYVLNDTALYAGFANDTSGSASNVTVTFRVLWLKATAG